MNEQDEFKTWQHQWQNSSSGEINSHRLRSALKVKALTRRKRPVLLWMILTLFTAALVALSVHSPLFGIHGFTQLGALGALLAAWLLAFTLRATDSFQTDAPAASVKQAIHIDLRKRRQMYLAKILAAFALGTTLTGLVLFRHRASETSFTKGSAFPLLVLITIFILLAVLKRFGAQKDSQLRSLKELDRQFECADREEKISLHPKSDNVR